MSFWADSDCPNFRNFIFTVTGCILAIVYFYFNSVVVGYTMTNIVTHHACNNSGDNRTCSFMVCHYDGANAFYFGCFLIGLVCYIIVIIVIFGIYRLCLCTNYDYPRYDHIQINYIDDTEIELDDLNI